MCYIHYLTKRLHSSTQLHGGWAQKCVNVCICNRNVLWGLDLFKQRQALSHFFFAQSWSLLKTDQHLAENIHGSYHNKSSPKTVRQTSRSALNLDKSRRQQQPTMVKYKTNKLKLYSKGSNNITNGLQMFSAFLILNIENKLEKHILACFSILNICSWFICVEVVFYLVE